MSGAESTNFMSPSALDGRPSFLAPSRTPSISVRRDVRPHGLHFPEKDVSTRAANSLELGKQLVHAFRIGSCLLVQTPQITAPAVDEELCGVSQHGRGSLVVPAIVTSAKSIDAILPACFHHALRCAIPRREKFPRRCHGDVRGDPSAQQRGKHKQLVQRRGSVGQPDPGLFRVRLPVPVEQHVDDRVALPCQGAFTPSRLVRVQVDSAGTSKSRARNVRRHAAPAEPDLRTVDTLVVHRPSTHFPPGARP